VSAAARGKSIARIAGNEAMVEAGLAYKGLVVDLAAGGRASYIRALALHKQQVRLVRVDYEHAYSPDVVADLTADFPFCDRAADFVFSCSYLYTLKDPSSFLRRAVNLLRPGGVFVATVPFVFPYTPEPRDYCRYTEEGLRELLERFCFRNMTITPYGGRISSSLYLLHPFWARLSWFAGVVYWFALRIDRLLEGHPILGNCPTGYLVLATKE
jgi:SAM-dependent methyltransferase